MLIVIDVIGMNVLLHCWPSATASLLMRQLAMSSVNERRTYLSRIEKVLSKLTDPSSIEYVTLTTLEHVYNVNLEVDIQPRPLLCAENQAILSSNHPSPTFSTEDCQFMETLLQRNYRRNLNLRDVFLHVFNVFATDTNQRWYFRLVVKMLLFMFRTNGNAYVNDDISLMAHIIRQTQPHPRVSPNGQMQHEVAAVLPSLINMWNARANTVPSSSDRFLASLSDVICCLCKCFLPNTHPEHPFANDIQLIVIPDGFEDVLMHWPASDSKRAVDDLLALRRIS